MLKRGLLHISFILMLAILWQCSETKEVNLEGLGTNYFPLKVGMYQLYQVNGTRYVSYVDSVVFSYLLKETVIDSFQNLESGILYKIEREKKNNDDDFWVVDSIWTARKYDQYAVRVENNIPIVSLTFPVKENKSWDGNKLNDRGIDEFEMIDINKHYSDAYGDYSKTLKVIQEELPDVYVKSVSKKEIYAEDLGLIYKENIILNFRQDTVYYGKEVIESGIKYYQHLIEYGEK